MTSFILLCLNLLLQFRMVVAFSVNIAGLTSRIIEHGNSCPNDQYWVAIAGGPGSGKSTVAETVAESLNKEDPGCCIVLPMDGYHYPRAKLDELDPTGAIVKRKGAPWTFDAELFVQDMTEAKVSKAAQLPTYCRKISDPVPGGAELKPSHKYVIVEGNYILMEHDERWAPLANLWDDKWFVKCSSRDEQRQRLIRRTMETWSDKKNELWGLGEIGAAARVDFNDVKNMDMISHCESFADVVVLNDDAMGCGNPDPSEECLIEQEVGETVLVDEL